MTPSTPPRVRTVLHIDMDAFFASVEQRDNPTLRGRPVVVGALPGSRGVVSAASYEARRFGVHSAMPIREAQGRCPSGVFVRPRMAVYSHESERVMEILREFSPELEQVSVDEAFLDITGSERLLGPARQVAENIRRAIHERLDLTASIGIGPNKFLAKIASDLNKPNGITEVPLGQNAIEQWLAPMPVGKLWGVGRKTDDILRRMGIRTVADLQKLDRAYLSRRFGAWGDALHELCRGIDTRDVVAEPDAAKSISREQTFQRDTTDRELLERTLLSQAQDVAQRARQAGMKGRTVVLVFRFSDFQKHSRRRTLSEATWLGKQIYEEACGLLSELPPGRAIRLIGVGLTGFGDAAQTNLFGQAEDSRWETSEKTVDALSERFGRKAVMRGREIDRRADPHTR
jgi:DNA polymerase IV